MSSRNLRIGVVGCGYVVDDYLRTLDQHPDLVLDSVTDLDPTRAQRTAHRYGVRVHATTADLLADPGIDLVLNLTNPRSHHEVSRAALLADKHVYGEKPMGLDVTQARELVDLARGRGLLLSGAPCNLLGSSWVAARRAVQSGRIGQPKVVYAELDDNPIYLMRPDLWRNETGTPWPWRNEFEVGCTLEHASYHVAALAAAFGPVESLVPFAACLVPGKGAEGVSVADSPDLSVAVLRFASGTVARLTCSIVAPYDHRVRIIGDAGMVTLDECWRNDSPVYVETFTQLSLNARKISAVRHSSVLSRLTGTPGRRLLAARTNRSSARPAARGRLRRGGAWASARQELRRRQMISMDFLLGVQDMADALAEDRDVCLTPEFLLHVTEVTLLISGAPTLTGTVFPHTAFTPLALPDSLAPEGHQDGPRVPRPRTGILDDVIVRLHQRGPTHQSRPTTSGESGPDTPLPAD